VICKLLLILLVAATSSFAADITTRDGTTYHNVEVTGVDADGIRVMHSKGVAKLRFEELPEPLQKQYHYDAAKVGAYRKQVEDAQKAAAAQAAAAQQQREREIQEAQDAERRRTEEAQRREQERIAAEERQKHNLKIAQEIGIITGLFIGVFLYFLPSVVGRRKTNATAIFMLNLFLGWTFLGWVLALVWACTKDSAQPALESRL
jgi:tetrahydromethanopterin S-methyltransferase subunit G